MAEPKLSREDEHLNPSKEPATSSSLVQDKDCERDGESTDSSHTVAAREECRDPNIIDWDGPDDPENPLNWSFGKKTSGIAVVSAITFISPLTSSIFAPGIPEVMEEFQSTNAELASFIVTVYVLGYAFGPLAIAPLSELYGRAPLYHVCNVLFVIFNVACALAPNLAVLIVFRLLAGLAGSCPLALGPGSIADLVRRKQRGKVMAAWVFGPLIGPVVGPIGGGYLTQAKGWRWSFWVLSIAAGFIAIVSFIFLRETYAYAILGRKAKKLRQETGNNNLRSVLDTGHTPKEVFRLAIVRPSKMLVFSPIVLLLSLYLFVLYGYQYLIFTAIPALFKNEYGFDAGQIGLAYVGMGVGCAVGLLLAGAISDRLVAILQKKNDGVFQPEFRLPLMVIAGVVIPLGLFWFGWTAQTHQHWMHPIIGTAFVGGGTVLAFMSVSTYLVDAYTTYAASASAACTVLRSTGGAVLPLAGGKMFDKLGLGWGSSLLAFIALGMMPVPLVFYRYGRRIREKNAHNVHF